VFLGGKESGPYAAMSEEDLLEEDIWEYKSVRKQKQQSASESPSAPLQKVTDGKRRPKRKGNGNKRKKVGKNGTLQKSEPRSRPNEDPEPSKDDSSVHSQESAGSQAENGSQSARPVHDGHCPSCQMPFSLLLVQTPRWHVAECLDTPGSTEKGMSRVRKKSSGNNVKHIILLLALVFILGSKREMVVGMIFRKLLLIIY